MGDVKEFIARLARIEGQDPRYKQDAYFFVMTALGRAVRDFPEPRHVTGSELLAAIRQEAEHQFGPMSSTVFAHWGIKNSLDFGRIVFNMVREGILSKTERDALEDFNDSVFFENLFDHDAGYRLADEEGALKDLSK